MTDLLEKVTQAASFGAESTKHILAKNAFGRSSYVGEEFCKGIPDPGAMAVAIWLTAVAKALRALQ